MVGPGNLQEDKIFDSVETRFASQETIRSWSWGGVRKPETIHYQTFHPGENGFLCEKRFGSTRDWECSCRKHRKIRHKGIVGDRCGVEMIHSVVRRDRMGHIKLTCCIRHIWLFSTMPSVIWTVLGLFTKPVPKHCKIETGN
jgi:DNA-directed RNA polymerase subunit beta'